MRQQTAAKRPHGAVAAALLPPLAALPPLPLPHAWQVQHQCATACTASLARCCRCVRWVGQAGKGATAPKGTSGRVVSTRTRLGSISALMAVGWLDNAQSSMQPQWPRLMGMGSFHMSGQESAEEHNCRGSAGHPRTLKMSATEEVIAEAPVAAVEPEAKGDGDSETVAPAVRKLPPGVRIPRPVRPVDDEIKAQVDALQQSSKWHARGCAR